MTDRERGFAKEWCSICQDYVPANVSEEHQRQHGVSLAPTRAEDFLSEWEKKRRARRPLGAQAGFKDMERYGAIAPAGEYEGYSAPYHYTHKKCAHGAFIKELLPLRLAGMSHYDKVVPAADVYCYLDRAWLENGTIWTDFRSRLAAEGRPQSIYVQWSDRGIIPSAQYAQLVRYLAQRLKGGEAVAAGCLGGHGRTGTVLAGIVRVVRGLDGMSAIAWARQNYCDKAIETAAQEKMVIDMDKTAFIPF